MIPSPQSAVPLQMSAAEMRERAQRRDTKLMLWGIVALGAALRLVALGAKSFWLDEIASVVIARMPGNSFWHWLWTEEGNMALYYVMLRPWLEIHLGEATVRLLSVLPGVASLPVMYLLGKRLFGRNVGMLAALFLALSTCAVVYSQEARGYSWLLLGTIVSTYFFARLVARPTYAMACGYALAAGVTFYFHYFGLLVPLAHAVSLMALPKGRRPWKQLFVAGGIVTLFALPVLWMIHTQPVRHLDWVSKPSLLEIYHLGVFLAAESGKGVGPALLAVELLLLAVFFRTMRGVRRSREAGREFWPYALVASGLLTPVIVSLLVSVVQPVFFHRFLIICLPAWLLACAVGACALRERPVRLWAIVGVCALSLVSTSMSYSRMREDWRGAVNYLIDNARAQDVVLYYQPVGNWAAESYRDWLPGGGANRPTALGVSAQSNDWRTKVAGARRVW
ncbi:MAG: glycosyltransferase family 39 protein, partial [Candidatus Korobacteraceae bacterium]